MEPLQLSSNGYWGRRSGTYSTQHPKGHTRPWGNIFKQQQWGTGSNNQTTRNRRNKCGVKIK